MIVRWGLGALGELLEPYERPLLISTERWRDLEVPVHERFHGVRPHAERGGVDGAIRRAQDTGADALVGLGGGSAIDTAKAVSATTDLPLFAVPTTYAGAEWTPYFGIRDAAAGMKGGGSGASTIGIVYEPALTLGLSRDESGGTAMNALAHCVEALYVSDSADARQGAALIDEWLPCVLANGQDEEGRRRLLEGAMQAGIALRDHGLYLGHAMAQALGGRYGLPHGALNAICLPAAMRFNAAIEPFGIQRVEELARLCGFTRLRDLDVPEGDLREVAEATAVRGGAQANPRPASAAQIEELLRAVW